MKDSVFLFPGQGSQAVGMGKNLYEKTDLGKKIFKMADDILGYPLSRICTEGPEEELTLTYNSQPALLTVSYILYRLLGQQPGLAAGHSLGEYSALVCAGVIKYEDAVLLVHKRGKYMQEAVPVGVGAMAAIMGVDIAEIRQALSSLDGRVGIANWNSSFQVVISGEKEAVEEALTKIDSKKTKMLPVSAPFHSNLMLPAEEKLAVDLDRIDFMEPVFPVITNVAAEEITSGADAREALKKQVSRTVLWYGTMRKLIQEKGSRRFIELGSGKVLTGLARRTAKEFAIEAETISIQDLDDLAALTSRG